ncbi:hypothetical protein SAMN05428983_4642 [Agrobacterium fabrum]|uniref:Uncharacterized protein n=1 Tax=Agrobacterium fabrum TaxID=1176649 RepID=A0A7Z7BRW4_9HYPH|nr:hypothetical protein SAMN05428983_4642 [Agrobacterium fabrum]
MANALLFRGYVSVGQSRVLLIWTDIIFPIGRSKR